MNLYADSLKLGTPVSAHQSGDCLEGNDTRKVLQSTCKLKSIMTNTLCHENKHEGKK